MRRFWLVLLTPLLGACGLVPLPEVQGNDFYFVNTVPDLQPFEVVYIDGNQLDRLQLPKLTYRNVTMDAVLTVHGLNPEAQLQLYAAARRPSCPVVAPPADYSDFSDALRCSDPAGGQLLSEVVLKRNVGVPVHLEGAVLDEALRTKVLYLGVRVLRGQPDTQDYVEVSQIRVRGRL